jgi:hypothetical protein
MSLPKYGGHSGTYKYPRIMPLRGQINRAIAIPCRTLQSLSPLPRWIYLLREASSNIWRPPFVLRTNNPRWHPSKLIRRQPHPSTKQRRQRCWLRKKARPSRTTPPKRPPKTKLSAKDSAKSTPPPKAPYAHAAPKDYRKHHLQASLHQKAKMQ